MASVESGVRVRRVCPGCGSTDYSRVTHSTKLIDLAQWDGSDFFRLKPVEGFIFVTDRVIQALRDNGLTGWKAQSLEELQRILTVSCNRETHLSLIGRQGKTQVHHIVPKYLGRAPDGPLARIKPQGRSAPQRQFTKTAISHPSRDENVIANAFRNRIFLSINDLRRCTH